MQKASRVGDAFLFYNEEKLNPMMKIQNENVLHLA